MSFVDLFQISMLVLFILVFGGRTIALSLKGTRVIVLGAAKRMPGAALEILILIGLPLWCWEVAVHALHLDLHVFPAALYQPLFESSALAVVGIAAVSGGFIIFVWALISFGLSWRVGIDTRKPGKLVTSGAFSFSRNPIFLFMDLYFAGTAMIWSNLFFLAFALITIAGIHFQIKEEEHFLATQYGDDYKDYSGQVRRYL